MAGVFGRSRLGLGTWPFGGGLDWGALDEAAAQKAVFAALDAGISWIDTAPVYGDGQSENFLGRVLAGQREQVWLASKCGLVKNGSWTDHDLRPASVRAQLEQTLTRLRTDYLDLYQIHYPDPHVPLEDALGELERLRAEGKIREVGLCNVSAEQLQQAVKTTRIFSVQNEYSLLHPQAGIDLFETCRQTGVFFIGYGVLCGGILSGKYKTAPNLRRADARNYFYKCYRAEAFAGAQETVERVRRVAVQKQVPPVAVAIAWALSHLAVASVLVGARSPEQIAQNAVGMSVQLTEPEIRFLENGHASE